MGVKTVFVKILQNIEKNMNKIKKLLLKNNLWHFGEPIVLKARGITRDGTSKNLALIYKNLINSGDLVFDIGANRGIYAKSFFLLGANVVAVEPQSKLAESLGKMNIFKVVRKGVSDKAGKGTIFICEDQKGISTFSEKYKTNFSDYRYNKKELVDMTTLDNLIKEFGLPKYCKIDVEGLELKVLQGLTKPIPFISIE